VVVIVELGANKTKKEDRRIEYVVLLDKHFNFQRWEWSDQRGIRATRCAEWWTFGTEFVGVEQVHIRHLPSFESDANHSFTAHAM